MSAIEATDSSITTTPEGIPAEQADTGLIGIEEEQPETPASQAFNLAQGVNPESIVLMDGEKPIRASELNAYLLRQQDYTQKTQKLKELYTESEKAIGWYNDYADHIGTVAPLINALALGDQNALTGALTTLQEQLGIKPQAQRGPDGRFAKEADAELYDLEDFEGDPVGLEMAKRHNALVMQNRQGSEKLSGLEKKLDQFLNGVQQAQVAQQHQQAVEGIAAKLTQRGVEGVDTKAALAMVGQPKTPDEAMILANFRAIHERNVKAVTQTPSNVQPNGSARMPTGDNSKKSLSQMLEENYSKAFPNR